MNSWIYYKQFFFKLQSLLKMSHIYFLLLHFIFSLFLLIILTPEIWKVRDTCIREWGSHWTARTFRACPSLRFFHFSLKTLISYKDSYLSAVIHPASSNSLNIKIFSCARESLIYIFAAFTICILFFHYSHNDRNLS